MTVRIPTDFHVSTDPIVRSMFNADLYDWWGRMLNLQEVHKYATGKGVEIAILDSGYSDHPDIRTPGLLTSIVDFTSDNTASDFNGHGSHVRGIIGMQPNGQGYVGVSPDAIIHVGKVLSADGVGSESWLLEACDWILDLAPDIVNMSLALDGSSDKMAKKINQMQEKGILLVAAAGNNFQKELAFPASHIFSLAVGAHDSGKLPANFSNTAKNLEQAKKLLLAPGVHVNSAWIDGNYRSASGSCIRGDQWVHFIGGYKPIKDISKGDQVWTLNEKTEELELRVVQAKIYSGKKKVYKVTTDNDSIICTDNHPFLKQFICNKGTGPMDLLRQYDKVISWTELKDINVGDVVVMSKCMPPVNPSIDIPITTLGHFNESTAYVLGYWLGDGWFSYGSMRMYAKREFWSDLYDRIEHGFPQYEIKTSYRSVRNEYNIAILRVASKAKELGFIGGASRKIVPAWVYSLPHHFKYAFLAGYFDSDGSITAGDDWRNCEFYSSSFNLIKGIKKLLDSLDVRSCNIYERPHYNGGIIYDRVIHQKLPAYKINSHQLSKLKPLSLYLLDKRYSTIVNEHKHSIMHESVGRVLVEGRRVRPSPLRDGLYFGRITSIEEGGLSDVWDIEVDGNHNFLCENFIVHNSMACPMVAGSAALIIELERNLGS